MPSIRLLTIIATICLAIVTAQHGAMQAPGLSPRYYLGGQLVERQNGDCPLPNSHTCLDINAGSFCCANTHYCIVQNGNPSCCFIGSTCGSPCDANHYECPTTTTVSGTATVSTSCCPRACTTTSQYLCPSALGGGCCSYDSNCASNSQCIPTSTSSSRTGVTGVSSGCPTSQSACASTLGGGCCNIGSTCTVVDNTNYCASNTALATRTGPAGILASDVPPSSGLSTGAKAGIGAGVAVGALVVISCVLWFCLSQRRRARNQQTASGPAMSEGSESGGKRPSNGRQGSDYFGPTAGVGPFTEHHDSTATSPGNNRGVPVSPQSPGDIQVPVEIDSRDSRGHSNVTTPGAFEHIKSLGTTADPIELP